MFKLGQAIASKKGHIISNIGWAASVRGSVRSSKPLVEDSLRSSTRSYQTIATERINQNDDVSTRVYESRVWSDSSFFDPIRSVPPTSSEVEAVIESISERPEVLRVILPKDGEVEPGFVDNVFDRVREAITNSDVVEATCKKLSSSQISQYIKTVLPPENDQWLKLKDQFPCSICMDVLAAPTLLNCSHSYCGVCIDDYVQSCTSNEIEVKHSCPECKAEIQSITFERTADSAIESMVDKVPDCESKTIWADRRAAYQRVVQDRARARDKERLAAEEEKREEAEEEQFKDDVLQNAIAIATILVIAIVVVARYKSKSA